MPFAKGSDLGSATSKSSSTTIVITTTAAINVGDEVLVAYGGSTTTSAVSSVTDSGGNSYTILKDQAGTTSRVAAAMTSATNAVAAGGTITVTLAVASSIRVAGATSFSGGTTVQDVTAVSASGASSTPSVGPSAATSTADTMTYAVFVVSNATASGTLTQGTGYTLDQAATTGTSGTNRSLGTEHQINSTTGTQTANGTYGSSMAWDGIEVVLQAASTSTPKSFGTDTGTGADSFTPSATVAVTDAGTGADTIGESATVAFADSAAGADSVSAQATTPFTDSGTGHDQFSVTGPPPPDVPSGGGGDAWSGYANRPYLRTQQLPPAPYIPEHDASRQRTTRGQRRAIAREQLDTHLLRYPEARPPQVRFPSTRRRVSFADVARGSEEFDVMATETRRPPRIPYQRQIEELEMLLLHM